MRRRTTARKRILEGAEYISGFQLQKSIGGYRYYRANQLEWRAWPECQCRSDSVSKDDDVIGLFYNFVMHIGMARSVTRDDE